MKRVLLYLSFSFFSFGVYAQTAVKIGPNETAGYSVTIGNNSGSLSGEKNVMVGFEAGMGMTTGKWNVLLGSSAGSGLTTGTQNVVIGQGAGLVLATGHFNTLIGRVAGYSVKGTGNTFIGAGAGYTYLAQGGVANTTGNNNTLLGYGACTGAANLTNATAIGYQAIATGSNSLVLGNNNVNVGIGTSAPSAKLEIKSNTAGVSGLKFTDLTSASSAITSNGKVLTVDSSGNVVLAVDGGSSTTSTASGWTAASVGTNNIINTNTGGVIIGSGITSLPAGYKLYVAEGILAEKAILAVKNSTNWADYVFENDYKLRSLSEVERFIAQHKHLPEVPSASEVVKNGINVAETQALLLKKVEELTLYIIAQEKQLKAQDEKLRKLEEGK